MHTCVLFVTQTALCVFHCFMYSVMLYDTEQMYPLGLIKQIHCLSITDLCWSSDGLCLCVSSTDGYCTFIRFQPQELGTPLSPTGTRLPFHSLSQRFSSFHGFSVCFRLCVCYHRARSV